MRGLAASALLLALTMAPAANAEDLSLYSKTGYMNWKETEKGRQFIRENGPTQELGLKLRTRPWFLEMNGTIALWGAVFGYDGASAETAEPKKMTTGVMGGKADYMLATPVHLTPRIELAPMAAVGAGYFWRSVGPEHWLVLNAKAGARLRAGNFEVLGGMMLPWKTWNIVDWTEIGARSRVTLQPRGMATPFVEANVHAGRWKIGLFYEPFRWRASRQVPFSYTGNNPAAALATATGIHQPDTRVQYLGVSAEFRF